MPTSFFPVTLPQMIRCT